MHTIRACNNKPPRTCYTCVHYITKSRLVYTHRYVTASYVYVYMFTLSMYVHWCNALHMY